MNEKARSFIGSGNLYRFDRSIHRGDHLASSIIDSVLHPAYATLRPPLSLLIDHIEYVINLVGVDYVGIGSDFDGIEILPLELDDVSCLPLNYQRIAQTWTLRGGCEKDFGG